MLLSVSTFKWYQYGFTRLRALFTYIRLTILPVGQSLDQDYPTSHTITEHGAPTLPAVAGRAGRDHRNLAA